MSVRGYLQALARGIDVVADCAGLSERDLVSLGATPADAAELVRFHQAYFGPTAYTGKQRRAVAAARELGHGMTTLRLIESYVGRVKKQAAAWDLRVELCATPAADVARVARERLRSLRPDGPAAGVRITRRARGNHTLSITDSSLAIADIASVLKAARPDNLLEAVKDVFFRNGAGAAPAVSTNVILTLDELDQIVDWSGVTVGGPSGAAGSAGAAAPAAPADDIVLRLTNGATMTGAQLVARTLTEHGYVTLIHPVQGPVNLYRTSRFASEKQRLMLAAETPACAWPDCNFPADECQAHHLVAWNAGGDTNVACMTMVCPYHNGVNDDRPNEPPDGPPGPNSRGAPSRGRLARIRGRIGWLPPWGGPPRFADE